MLEHPLRIYTAVWGKKFIELFKKTALKSLHWQQNLEALMNVNQPIIWSLYSNEEDLTEVETIVQDAFGDFITIETNSFSEKIEGNHPKMGNLILDCFVKEIEKCLQANAKLLLAPPDTIFGDGSLRGLFTVGAHKGICVAVPHPRVLDTILKSDDQLTNPQLVSLAWQHLHRTWSEAKSDREKNNAHVGGIYWKEVKKGLYTVQHRLPTNYLIHFNKDDLEFFKNQISFGVIDHLWPIFLLKREQQRYIGSSDVAFIVEVTEEKQNVPPCYPVNINQPDGFWRQEFHNKIFRQMIAVFRGVECE